MNLITFSEQQKEYIEIVKNIPQLQQQLLAASLSFTRPIENWENKSSIIIQKCWRNYLRKLHRPDPDMMFFGSLQWSWRISESDDDKFRLIMSQPVDTIKDSLVKVLREKISSYETYLGDEDSKMRPDMRTHYGKMTHELQHSLRQLITYKLIFEYSKTNSSSSEMISAYKEINQLRKKIAIKYNF